jgi:nitrite reductase/ring-hydroxylating ferredoxin subunit
MRLCHLDDLPDGHSRGFDPQRRGRDSVLVVRQGRRLFAYADRCPHHGTPMAWRQHAYLNAEGDRIVCAAHGAQFEIHTGLCTLGPCLGQALQPLPLTVQANGQVHLAIHTPLETYP